MLLEITSARSRRRRNLARMRATQQRRAEAFDLRCAERRMRDRDLTPAERAARETAHRRELVQLYAWILFGNSVVGVLGSVALLSMHVRWPLAIAAGAAYVVLATCVLILPRGPSADLRAYFLQRRTPPSDSSS